MGQTPSQIADSITNSISSSISNSLSNLSANTSIEQSISVSCSDVGIINQTTCVLGCVNTLAEHNYPDIKDVCGDLCGCRISNINFNDVVIITNNIKTDINIQNDLKTSVKDSLEQYRNDNTDQQINDVINNYNSSQINILSELVANTNSSQVIIAKDYIVNIVTMDQSINIINNLISNTSVLQKSINDVSKTISQVSISSMNTVIYIGVIILALFILVFLIITLTKSKDFVEFFHKLIPYTIFTVIAVLVAFIHIILKPSYVTYTLPGETEKHIDTKKLILFLTIYYIVLGFLMFIITKIINRKNNLDSHESNTNLNSHESE